jgi:hypothetical protein
MMQLAVRYGAVTANPVREVDAIEHPAKNPHAPSEATKSISSTST